MFRVNIFSANYVSFKWHYFIVLIYRLIYRLIYSTNLYLLIVRNAIWTICFSPYSPHIWNNYCFIMIYCWIVNKI